MFRSGFSVRWAWCWPSEVAKTCTVSRTTVYRWIERGTIIPILKIRPFKILQDQVEGLLAEGSDQPC